jgi:hypothetical protein
MTQKPQVSTAYCRDLRKRPALPEGGVQAKQVYSSLDLIVAILQVAFLGTQGRACGIKRCKQVKPMFF